MAIPYTPSNRRGRGEKPFRIGDKRKDDSGYVLVKRPDHPFCNSHGYIQEHRLVMEQHIGRYLNRKEVIHHKNGIVDDNRIENLQLCASSAEHLKIHRPDKFCHLCGKPHRAHGLCDQHYKSQWEKSVRVPCPKCGKPIEKRSRAKAKDGVRLCLTCRRPKSPCRICGKPHCAHGLCKRHYAQWRNGNPFT